MIKKISIHLPHYLSLIGIFIAAFIGFIVFSYDRTFQAAIAIGMAAGYVSWGIIHHVIHRDLYWEVVIEYMVFALLGMTVILSVIFRS